MRARLGAALSALRRMPELTEDDPFAAHRQHEIKTASGEIAGAEVDV